METAKAQVQAEQVAKTQIEVCLATVNSAIVMFWCIMPEEGGILLLLLE